MQVTDVKYSPPVWEAFAQATNYPQLLVLQRAFDTAAEDMGLRTLTIATPSLLKLVLALGFRMESRDDLTTGIHPFILGLHMALVRKFLRGQADRYAMVASSAGALSLADAEILSAPDGVTLLRNFSMARGQWLQTRQVVGTCFGVDHNTSEGLTEFREEMLARETDLEEYIPREAALRPQVPALILLHAQIRWSNWIAVQWGKTSEFPFPNLTGIWTDMENQEPWEPTFPAVYTFPPKTSMEAVVAVAQPPNQPIRKGGPQSTRRPRRHQRPKQQQRLQPHRQKLRDKLVGDAAAAASLAEEEEVGDAEAVAGGAEGVGGIQGVPQRHCLKQQFR